MFVVYLVNNNLVGHCVSLSGCRWWLLCGVYWAIAPFLTSLGLGPWWQVNHQTVYILAVYVPDTLLNSGGLSHLDLNQMHFPTDFLWTSFILNSLMTGWLNAELGGSSCCFQLLDTSESIHSYLRDIPQQASLCPLVWHKKGVFPPPLSDIMTSFADA